MRFVKIILPLLFVTLFFSCRTVPKEVSQEWEGEDFFVMAQEASDDSAYNVSEYYYQVYIVRYPENHTKIVAAEYEVALIAFKKKKYNDAKFQMEAILEKYKSSPYVAYYDPRYKILAEKIIKKIDVKKLGLKGKMANIKAEGVQKKQDNVGRPVAPPPSQQ